MHFGRPLAHFWHPLASKWLPLGSRWLPFGSLSNLSVLFPRSRNTSEGAQGVWDSQSGDLKGGTYSFVPLPSKGPERNICLWQLRLIDTYIYIQAQKKSHRIHTKFIRPDIIENHRFLLINRARNIHTKFTQNSHGQISLKILGFY